MTQWPDSPEHWRATTALFGQPDWDTGVLYWASVADASDSAPHGATVAEAVAGDGDAARRLGTAGIVAVRVAGQIYEVHETLDGWQLVTERGTPDVAGLAMAAALRAARLAGERRTGASPR